MQISYTRIIKNLAEAQKIADVEDVTAISERLIKQNMEHIRSLLNDNFE